MWQTPNHYAQKRFGKRLLKSKRFSQGTVQWELGILTLELWQIGALTVPWEKRRGDLCPQSSQKTRLRTDRIFPCAPTSLHVQQPQHTEPMLALVATSTLNSSPKSATQKAMTSYQNSGREGVHMTQQAIEILWPKQGRLFKNHGPYGEVHSSLLHTYAQKSFQPTKHAPSNCWKYHLDSWLVNNTNLPTLVELLCISTQEDSLPKSQGQLSPTLQYWRRILTLLIPNRMLLCTT